jgi:aspartyl-tRNA(Asn)/glutamyl-tRNA(Gln) amidotransferase subunit B
VRGAESAGQKLPAKELIVAQRVCKSYKVLVGMEIHVQLATKSKMFTGAANGFGGEPNSQVDAVVLGLPGVLPVMNRKAVEYSIKAGLALGCRIARFTKWDRKSYYYPDLPKNYQISQYDLPLCGEGNFEIPDDQGNSKIIRIRRAHLEEDAGKLMHEAPGGYHIDHTIVDLNRAGTPLLEIVTEPDLSTPKEVAMFGQELQKIVQYLGVSEGQMQLGHMRFEPNINVHITDQDGTVHTTAITEIKNLNSFSVLEKATAYEIRRQINLWEETGDLGKKSTYGWDDAREITVHQRDKEGESDYRYFPDPDLMPVIVDDAWLAELKSQIGELPVARRKRYVEVVGLSIMDAATLAGDRETGDLFDQSVAAGADAKRVANLLLSHGRRLANERNLPMGELGLKPQRVAELANLIASSKLAAAEPAGKVMEKLLEQDAPAEQIAGELGILQSSDTGAIDSAIEAMLATNPKSLVDYKAGKQAAFGALIGMVMKQAKGLNPKLVQERLKQRIG